MTLDDILGRLDKPKTKLWKGHTGYTACCPAHDDKNPSFIVYEKNGYLHFYCQAGCTEDAILRSLGMQLEDMNTAHKNGEAKPKITA